MATKTLPAGLHTQRIGRMDDCPDRAIAMQDGVPILRAPPAAGWDGAIGSGEIEEFLLDNLPQARAPSAGMVHRLRPIARLRTPRGDKPPPVRVRRAGATPAIPGRPPQT